MSDCFETCVVQICGYLVCKQETAYEMRISDWSSVVCSPGLAEGYGVYIRNPLAHHIADFMLADWEELGPERLVEAKLAAFGYADHLAEHLGCAVEAGARPAAAVPVGDLLHGAA